MLWAGDIRVMAEGSVRDQGRGGMQAYMQVMQALEACLP